MAARRYCGLVDDYSTFGDHYPADIGAVTVSIFEYHDQIDPTIQRDELQAAMDLWNAELPYNLIYAGDSQTNALIKVRFVRGAHGDGQPFDGPGNVLAHATGPQTPGWCHIDLDEVWRHWAEIQADPSIAGFLLRKVIGHELGHNIGAGHSGVPGSLMWPRYGTHTFALGPDDRELVAALYPNESPGGAPGAAGRSSPQAEARRWGRRVHWYGSLSLLRIRVSYWPDSIA